MDKVEITTDKLLGCLYGQAIGDALGLGSEFMNKDEVMRHYPNGLSRYDQIIQDRHRCRWEKGAWTDDTDMMLCILNGFEHGEFNVHRIASNFKDWFNGEPMGIGSHTYKVLCMGDYVEQPEMCSKLWWDLSRQQSAANGALMRTSVVGLSNKNLVAQTETICKLTHYDPRCVGSCVIVTSIIHNLVYNTKELKYNDIVEIGRRYDDRICQWIDLAHDSANIAMLDLDDTHSIGYTLRTLAAALWCYWHSQTFEEGLLAVVNEGGDADTNAAVACSILGAKFGYGSIPKYYIDNLNNGTLYKQNVTQFMNNVLNDE